ncbi:MAG: HEPN domain-containing protein [Thermofilum sp.]
MPVRGEALDWLAEARADLRHAEVSISVGDYNWACFAARQADEKALKALILHALGEYARGHDLVKLYRKARSVGLSLSEGILSKLSAYYTVARYLNAGVERPSEEITRE